jgi:hypothetical protein
MTTILVLIVLAAVLGAVAYYTNAGFGDRKPRDARPPRVRAKANPTDQASAGVPDDAPPPHK